MERKNLLPYPPNFLVCFLWIQLHKVFIRYQNTIILHSIPCISRILITTHIMPTRFHSNPAAEIESSEYIQLSDVYPCCGLLCFLSSCYVSKISKYLINNFHIDFQAILIFKLKYPDCCGCTLRSTLCCLRNESLCCKPSRRQDSHCIFCDLSCDLAPCAFQIKVQHFASLDRYLSIKSIYYQSQNQICCEDCRCSIPPDDRDAPCSFAVLCLTVSIILQALKNSSHKLYTIRIRYSASFVITLRFDVAKKLRSYSS